MFPSVDLNGADHATFVVALLVAAEEHLAGFAELPRELLSLAGGDSDAVIGVHHVLTRGHVCLMYLLVRVIAQNELVIGLPRVVNHEGDDLAFGSGETGGVEAKIVRRGDFDPAIRIRGIGRSSEYRAFCGTHVVLAGTVAGTFAGWSTCRAGKDGAREEQSTPVP